MNSNDRRVKRSQRLLKESFLALLAVRSFKEISAKDITDAADLNRGTFYLHFPDTTALLESIEDDLILEAQNALDGRKADAIKNNSVKPILMPLLYYIEENRDKLQLLLNNSNAGSILEKLRKLIYDNTLEAAKEFSGIENERQIAYLLSYTCFGLLGMISEWTMHDTDMDKDLLAQYMENLLMQSLKAEFYR